MFHRVSMVLSSDLEGRIENTAGFRNRKGVEVAFSFVGNMNLYLTIDGGFPPSFSTLMGPSSGKIGAVFSHTDRVTHYLFLQDSTLGTRKLICVEVTLYKKAGVRTMPEGKVLWKFTVRFDIESGSFVGVEQGDEVTILQERPS